MHGLVQKILGTCERVANKFLHPGANYTYMYNLHTVCKSAHVNGALESLSLVNFFKLQNATLTDGPGWSLFFLISWKR